MRVPYAGDVRGITHGKACDAFEHALAEYVGVKHAIVVNSGSMANLIAFDALGLRPGDEVITTALCFPTTVAPIVKLGCVPVFIDVSFPTLNVDVAQLEAALSSRTRAVVLAHTLGNPFDVDAVKKFCTEHKLWLLEDNCDALGSIYSIQMTGSVGDISTLSFYPAHQITTGEGGAVLTSNQEFAETARSLRDWGRDCICPPMRDNTCGERFGRQYGFLPLGYDHKYVYSHLGYNAKMTEMQGELGVAEMGRLLEYVAKRRMNWAYLDAHIDGEKMVATPSSQPSWFAFALTTPDRAMVTHRLTELGIQTRVLFAGNITRQPCMEGVNYRALDLTNTDRVMRETFFVGVHPSMSEEQRAYLAENVAKAL